MRNIYRYRNYSIWTINYSTNWPHLLETRQVAYPSMQNSTLVHRHNKTRLNQSEWWLDYHHSPLFVVAYSSLCLNCTNNYISISSHQSSYNELIIKIEKYHASSATIGTTTTQEVGHCVYPHYVLHYALSIYTLSLQSLSHPFRSHFNYLSWLVPQFHV